MQPPMMRMQASLVTQFLLRRYIILFFPLEFPKTIAHHRRTCQNCLPHTLTNWRGNTRLEMTLSSQWCAYTQEMVTPGNWMRCGGSYGQNTWWVSTIGFVDTTNKMEQKDNKAMLEEPPNLVYFSESQKPRRFLVMSYQPLVSLNHLCRTTHIIKLYTHHCPVSTCHHLLNKPINYIPLYKLYRPHIPCICHHLSMLGLLNVPSTNPLQYCHESSNCHDPVCSKYQWKYTDIIKELKA